MLSPTDIRSAVQEVLSRADRGLSAYEILNGLPTDIRDRIIAERGMPGAGSGNSFSAASLVAKAVEDVLPSLEPPHRVYVNASNLSFEVARRIIRPGNGNIAFYRMSTSEVKNMVGPQPVAPPPVVPPPAPLDANQLASKALPVKLPWYENAGCLWLSISFWPLTIYGVWKTSRMSPKAKWALAVGTIVVLTLPNILPSSDTSSTETQDSSTYATPVASAEDQADNQAASQGATKPAKEAAGVFITEDGYFAAETKNQLRGAVLSATRKDMEGLNRLIRVGAVIPLKPGIRVRSIGHEGFRPTMVRVRVVEDGTEFWTVPEALKRGW